ncbi:hypothetical protein [Alicyclobacillus shizuokensis]|uniref:hypothetical protein n=1 Tax=Alicyclobacillus shizuokensis TaxID=392014 RepID=UPI000836CC04|nr:hypothetical protein [Alicyclobacillus shizuokensis]
MAVAATFEEAILEEDLAGIEEMLEAYEENGGQTFMLDELMVRKLIIKRKILREEVDRLKALRDAVKQEWDKKIQRVVEQIEDIDGLVKHYIMNVNGGKALKLDVATISPRKVNHNLVIKDPVAFEGFLAANGVRDQFLKEPQLDATKAKNYLLQKIEENPALKEHLPDCVEYQETDKTISIRMNV